MLEKWQLSTGTVATLARNGRQFQTELWQFCAGLCIWESKIILLMLTKSEYITKRLKSYVKKNKIQITSCQQFSLEMVSPALISLDTFGLSSFFRF